MYHQLRTIRRTSTKLKYLSAGLLILIKLCAFGQDSNDSLNFLNDRVSGIPTSLFGTYIEKGDIIVYPFYEFYKEKNEYKPSEFGFAHDQQYEGKFSAHEELIYLGYGIKDWLMIEAEASIIQARQQKSSSDTSNMPSHFNEGGIENIEGQLRWRYFKESQMSPELYSYLLTVLPTRGENKMIGTDGFDFKFGTGLIKGFRFGTVSANLSIQYNTEDAVYEFGGFTVEYLKRISNTFRIYVGLEGIPDATEFITELQIFPKSWMFIRLNNAIGISPNATDIAPEIGVVFYLNKLIVH